MMNNKALGLALAGLILLPGCLHVPTYKAKPLKDLNDNFVYREIKNNIVFQAKCLTHGEIYYLFGDHTKELLRTTEIIYCSIHNLSNQDYILSLKNQNFSPLSSNTIKQLLKTSSSGRLATGVGAVGTAYALFLGSVFNVPGLMGAYIVGTHIAFGIPHLLVFGPPIVFIIGALPFFGKGIKSIIMNNRINRDLNEKMLNDNAVIKSGNTLSGLIFVKASEYKPQFNLMLQEKSNLKNKIIFDIDLAANAKIMQ